MPQYTHNSLVHRLVDQSYPEGAAYLIVFGAIFASAAVMLKNRGRTSMTTHRLVLGIVVAALADHLVEQMFGIAQVSDLTLFWALLGVYVALPRVMGVVYSDENFGVATSGIDRRRSRL